MQTQVMPRLRPQEAAIGFKACTFHFLSKPRFPTAAIIRSQGHRVSRSRGWKAKRSGRKTRDGLGKGNSAAALISTLRTFSTFITVSSKPFLLCTHDRLSEVLSGTNTHMRERARERERHCHSKDPHVFCILHLFVMLYIQLLRTVRYCSSWVRWFTVGIRMFYRFRV